LRSTFETKATKSGGSLLSQSGNTWSYNRRVKLKLIKVFSIFTFSYTAPKAKAKG